MSGKFCVVALCKKPSNPKYKGYCTEHGKARASAPGPSKTGKKVVAAPAVGGTRGKKPASKPAEKPSAAENRAAAAAADDDDGDAEIRCASCGEDIEAGTSYVTALGNVYHPEHLCCTECGTALGQSEETPVYNFEGKVLCEKDYMAKFAKTCARCRKEIQGQFFRAMERDWHEACLCCSKCNEPLSGKPIYHKSEGNEGYKDGGEIYCQKDFQQLFGESCAACGEVLVGKFIKALGEKWHEDCFRCAECQEQLSGSFFVENDNVYCKNDYEQLYATRCAACGEMVKGTCLKALDKTFHKECFVCTHCKEPLQTGQFFLEGGEVYCLKDYEELFAVRCAACNEYVTGTVLHVLDKNWHKECFVCAECGKTLEEGFLKRDGQVYCDADYSKLFDLVCAGCDEVLEGAYVEVLGFTWHRNCFLCTVCLQPIQADSCYVQDNRVYCAKDFQALLSGSVQSTAAAQQESDEQEEDDGAGSKQKHTKMVRPSRLQQAEEEKRRQGAKQGAKLQGDGAGAAGHKGQVTIQKKRLAPISEEEARQNRTSPSSRGRLKKKEVRVQRASAEDFDVGQCLTAGLREVLGRERRAFRNDFHKREMYRPSVDAGMLDFEDFAPSIFHAIRSQYAISDQSFRESMLSLKGGSVGAGKSGALFFYSEDRRFLVKTITAEELAFFESIFPKYYRHLTRNVHTLIPRFFGLYQLSTPGSKRPVRLIIMNNIFDTPVSIDERYDLKGSRLDRFVEEDKTDGTVLKDLNFKGKIYLGEEQGNALRQQLTRDCAFLKSCKIMDQSFLLGIHRKGDPLTHSPPPLISTQMLMRPLLDSPFGSERGKVSVFQSDQGGLRAPDGCPGESEMYFFGIIDILQEFNLRKKVENAYKNIRYNKKSFSAVESKKYNNRFEAFIRSIVE